MVTDVPVNPAEYLGPGMELTNQFHACRQVEEEKNVGTSAIFPV